MAVGGGMEHLAGVVDRIRTIQSRIGVEAPPVGFAQALDRVTERGEPARPTPAGFRTFGDADAAAGPAGITLAQMLGRPLTPVPTTDLLPPLAPMSATDLVPPVGTAGAASTGTLRLPVDAPMSSSFGPRVHPVTGEWKQHAGIDLAAPTGTPIGAAAAGTVTFAGVRGGYGNLVIVDHGDGTETRYAHQHTIAVRAGQQVAVGDLLGTVGSTGMSTGPHLHLEVRRNGRPVDPAPLLGLA